MGNGGMGAAADLLSAVIGKRPVLRLAGDAVQAEERLEEEELDVVRVAEEAVGAGGPVGGVKDEAEEAAFRPTAGAVPEEKEEGFWVRTAREIEKILKRCAVFQRKSEQSRIVILSF